jgi:hypothetical protein
MEQRLNLIYLANDVVQGSRVQGRDFIEAFHKALPEAFKHMVKHSDDRVRQKLKKVVLVWRDRHVWGHKALGMYMDYVKGVEIAPSALPATPTVSEQPELLALAKILRDIGEQSHQGQKLAAADTAARKALADATASSQVSQSSQVYLSACCTDGHCNAVLFFC